MAWTDEAPDNPQCHQGGNDVTGFVPFPNKKSDLTTPTALPGSTDDQWRALRPGARGRRSRSTTRSR
jgi:hypothetical protein